MTGLNSLLHRTRTLALTNTSGSTLLRGDVGVIDTAFDESWRHETSGSSPARLGVGVVLDGTIAVNGRGLFAFGGYASRVNLTNTAARGDYLKLSTTKGKATASATPAAGDFAQALTSGSTPSAILFGFNMRA